MMICIGMGIFTGYVFYVVPGLFSVRYGGHDSATVFALIDFVGFSMSTGNTHIVFFFFFFEYVI